MTLLEKKRTIKNKYLSKYTIHAIGIQEPNTIIIYITDKLNRFTIDNLIEDAKPFKINILHSPKAKI